MHVAPDCRLCPVREPRVPCRTGLHPWPLSTSSHPAAADLFHNLLERIRVPWSTGSGAAKVASRARIRPHAPRAFADPLSSPAQCAQSSPQLSWMRPSRLWNPRGRHRNRRHRILGGFWISPGSVMKAINRMVASVPRASQTHDRHRFLRSTSQPCVEHG